MCNFNQYNQQFSNQDRKILGWDVVVIFECGRFWFYRRRPQTKYKHLHRYESIPTYLNPFGNWLFSITYLISLLLFKLYMNSVFHIRKFLTHWNVCRDNVRRFNNQSKIDTNQLLELFYLDESVFVRYVCSVLRELHYARWVLYGKS